MNSENKILELIAAKNHIDILSIKKFDSGQVNKVFNINDKYVVKIEGKPDIANGLLKGQPQKVERLVAKGAKVPEVIDFGEVEGEAYLLMEKVEGQNLISQWWSFTDLQKENYIEQVAEQLKIFHSIKSDKYFKSFDNFKDTITKETDFSVVNKSALKREYVSCVEILENFFSNKIELLNEKDTAVLTHNDLHFENIFYENGKITGIIDFDYSTYAPRDYEFKKLVDFVHTPTDYVKDKLEPKYRGHQLTTEIKMLKKYYPVLFQGSDLIDKVNLYSIEGLLWIINGYQKGRWSENAMIKTQKKIHDWYQSNWLESLLY